MKQQDFSYNRTRPVLEQMGSTTRVPSLSHIYQKRQFSVNGKEVTILADHIKEHNHDLYATGLVNVVVNGRAIAAGRSDTFEKLITDASLPVIMEKREAGKNRRLGIAVAHTFYIADIAVKFVTRTAELLEFAVFAFNKETSEWTNLLRS